MDRHSKLATALAEASGVSARRFVRWPGDLLPVLWTDDNGQILPEAVAHLQELSGLIARGKANADVGEERDYYDHVALTLAARGHGSERLRSVTSEIVAAMIRTFPNARTDGGEQTDEDFALMEDRVAATAASLGDVHPVIRDAFQATVSRAAANLSGSPEDVAHSLLSAAASAAAGDGLYDTETAIAVLGLDKASPEARDAQLLQQDGFGMRYDLPKLLTILDTAPLGALVAAAVGERIWTKRAMFLLNGPARTPAEEAARDAFAALQGVLSLSIDPVTIADFAKAHQQRLDSLDPETIAALPGIMPDAWRTALEC
jgi:hypothetical protein